MDTSRSVAPSRWLEDAACCGKTAGESGIRSRITPLSRSSVSSSLLGTAGGAAACSSATLAGGNANHGRYWRTERELRRSPGQWSNTTRNGVGVPQSTQALVDAATPLPSAEAGDSPPPKRNFAARLFGYDVFISFALGPAPRGSLSYASDLARRLRERDFSVFFSEDEAPPGEHLDSTLLKALHGSRLLVVIANRGTLEQPRWVRKEVEEFRRRHPGRPIIPISIGGALQDPALAAAAQEWLAFQDKIWLDESNEAASDGIASKAVLERLATAPTRVRANVWWRWLVRGVMAVLATLAVALGVAA